VKAVTDICDGKSLAKDELGGIYQTESLWRNGSVLTTSVSGEVDRNHPMT